jgi:fructose-1,6-bisphosphatase/inositol monophosphatase family enzyme
MPDHLEPKRFIEALYPVVSQCAEASRIFYGRVPDIGKRADETLTGSKAQDASTVFTALDSGLQDILLSVVLQQFPGIRCIAEESTALARRFRGNSSPYTVILDPIDGTLHFRNGDGPYHISIGLACKGAMVASVVARPTEDKIFTATLGDGAWVHTGDAAPRRLHVPGEPHTRRAFISSKARAYQPLATPEFEPREHPIGAALVLTLLAEGELCAYLTRQVEVYDVGPPSLIAEEAGVHCFLRNLQPPSYSSRRKFPFYMAAAGSAPYAKLRQMLQTTRKEGPS